MWAPHVDDVRGMQPELSAHQDAHRHERVRDGDVTAEEIRACVECVEPSLVGGVKTTAVLHAVASCPAAMALSLAVRLACPDAMRGDPARLPDLAEGSEADVQAWLEQRRRKRLPADVHVQLH